MLTIACPVCGRRITTSGAAQAPALCPACGASLLATDAAPNPAPNPTPDDARDDSATRPIPLDQFPTKPGPPSPADGETRDLPASALPKPPAASAARRLARGLGVVALIALLLAIVAGAAMAVNGEIPFTQRAATPTATASAPSPSATPATIPFTRPGLYRIAYPTGWLAPERNDPPSSYSVTFINPSGGASLTITLNQSPDLVGADTTDTNYLNSLASTTGTRPQNLSKPQAVTLAGQTWTEESADVAILTAAGKQYAHAVAMTVYDHGYVYTTVRLVPVTDQAGAQSAFDLAEQASFQPMLATFAFLG